MKRFSSVLWAWTLVAACGGRETEISRQFPGDAGSTGGSGTGASGGASNGGTLNSGGRVGAQCRTNSDCPQLGCFMCPATVCVNGQCVRQGGIGGTGGVIATTGGRTGTGGRATGGDMATGGKYATGGNVATGGNPASGGNTSSGGANGTGGQGGSGGRCSCGVGYSCCNNSCVNEANDQNNCGACGTKCAANEVCDSAHCVTPQCLTTCGGSELCCGSECCSAGSICCRHETPIDGALHCYTPTEAQPSCPAGCPLCP